MTIIRYALASRHKTPPDASLIQEVAREEGGEGGPAEHWRLPQPGKFGGQLPTSCGEPSLLHHGGGGVDDQQLGCPELMARMKKLR